MFPILRLGPAAIQTPGLFLIVGLWISVELAGRYFRKLGVESSPAFTLVTIGLVMAAAGGRLAYAVGHWEAFAASPASLISPNPDLLNWPAAIILGLGCSIGYGLHRRVNFWVLLDSLTPSFGVMMIAIGLANLASGSAFGEPVHLPWSVYLWGEWRHPSQVYDALSAVGVLGWILLRLSQYHEKSQPQPTSGSIFLEFLALSAVLQILLLRFRAGDALLFGQLRAGQVVAWIILAIVLFLSGSRRSSLPREEDNSGDDHGPTHNLPASQPASED